MSGAQARHMKLGLSQGTSPRYFSLLLENPWANMVGRTTDPHGPAEPHPRSENETPVLGNSDSLRHNMEISKKIPHDGCGPISGKMLNFKLNDRNLLLHIDLGRTHLQNSDSSMTPYLSTKIPRSSLKGDQDYTNCAGVIYQTDPTDPKNFTQHLLELKSTPGPNLKRKYQFKYLSKFAYGPHCINTKIFGKFQGGIQGCHGIFYKYQSKQFCGFFRGVCPILTFGDTRVAVGCSWN
jgi:hypothetical protein